MNTVNSNKNHHQSHQQQQQQQQQIPISSLVLPLSITCPGISICDENDDINDSFSSLWSGSLRAQVILRCYARWCLSRPLQIASHINVVLIDALVDAKGFINSAKLTKQLGLVHWSQIYETLRFGPCNSVVDFRAPSSLFVNNNNGGGKSNNNSTAVDDNPQQQQSSSSSQLVSNSAIEFAIDYRKALPHAFLSICGYFMNMFCESGVNTHELPESVKNSILGEKARTIKCLNCPNVLIAWAENEIPIFRCSQCYSENVCLDILRALVIISSSSSSSSTATTTTSSAKTKTATSTENNNSDGNPDRRKVQLDQHPVLVEIKHRLMKQSCYGAVCEQAQLFLQLYSSKFALIAPPSTPVFHPDRIFAAEEFSLLREMEEGSTPSANSSSGVDGENGRGTKTTASSGYKVRGIILGSTRPKFVEPAGTMDDWLPGLRVIRNGKSRQDLKKMIKKLKKQRLDEMMMRASELMMLSSRGSSKKNNNNASSSAFPPWLRDEQDEVEHPEEIETDDDDTSSDSKSSDDKDDRDADDDSEIILPLIVKEEEAQDRMRESDEQTGLMTLWQAMHAAEKERRRREIGVHHRRHHHESKRRQRYVNQTQKEGDDDEEWESIL